MSVMAGTVEFLSEFGKKTAQQGTEEIKSHPVDCSIFAPAKASELNRVSECLLH